MNKKILIVLLLGFILIGLTGCKEKQEDEVKLENSENKLVVAFSDKDELMVIKEGMVNDNGFIVDYKGNKKGSIEKCYDGDTYIMNGYVYTDSSINTNYIYDQTGKKLYSVKGKITGVSESGYALIEEEKSNMSQGDYIEYNIIDLKNGESIKSYEKDISDELIYTGYKDYFLEKELDAMQAGDLYDAKNQKEYHEYNINKEYLNKESNILKYIELPYEDNKDNAIGTDILSFENGLFLREGKLYDFNEKELKDISEGEIEYIYYYNDNIFVLTYTDYIYILDKNLDYATEPVKFSDTDLDNFLSQIGVTNHINYEIGVDNNPNDQLYTTTSGYYYVDTNSGEKAKIEIYDTDTFKKVKSAEVKINNNKDVKVTDYGILVDSKDDNVYLYSKDDEKVYKNSSIKNYSKRMANILIDGTWKVIDLSTMKELNIK